MVLEAVGRMRTASGWAGLNAARVTSDDTAGEGPAKS